MSSFAQRVCIPALLREQNQDGGWGHGSAHDSRVEPTCWALLALHQHHQDGELREALNRGSEWLQRVQLEDGSWPASTGQPSGCWVTAVACLALQELRVAADRCNAGRSWLVAQCPGEGGLWWRLRNRAARTRQIVRQNFRLRGWSWTPGTSSWVEPTAYALLLLNNTAAELRPAGSDKRISSAEGMLYDRMCPAGGWNNGNPIVYGVAGEPQIVPTAWALMALYKYRNRTENQKSLELLVQMLNNARGGISLALGSLCLKLHEVTCEASSESALSTLYERHEFLSNTGAMAFMALALGETPSWLLPDQRKCG